ncbi:MAG: biotin attachment protein [Alphaproteobacteria bacterium]|nr:biotin attachment protein [Alphaproteobacteria bacterium]|tara:strand:- start:15400 stop:15633 length:234 start_codon:yes stop_codon:yes gene_type:complete
MSEIRIPQDCWDDDSEGAISTWFYDDGDKVSAGDVICEVMNEKVSTEITAPVDGVLEIKVAAESPVKKGALIATIVS